MLDTELISATEKSSRRLMVVLHGLGDSVEGYRWLPEALRLPWLNYLLVNAPDEYYGGFSWYDYMGDSTTGIVRSRNLLSDLLDEQQSAGFPTDQTLLFGFSQGCLMTLDVGLRYPRRFAGLVGISGHIHDLDGTLQSLSTAAKQQRLLVTHGLYDPVIPFAPVKLEIQRLQESGLHVEWREFAKEHTIAGEDELRVIREFVNGGFA